jgi:steroid delta-isomerase-like uncharacterized protein
MKELPHRLFDAYNRHDPSTAAWLYTAEGSHEDIAQGRARFGPDAIADGLRRFFECFPDSCWESEFQITDQNGLTAVGYRFSATLQSPMGTVAAHGQSISLRGVLVLDVADGLIRRSVDYWDGATFQRQLNHGEMEGTK